MRGLVKLNLNVLFWFLMLGAFIFMYFEADNFRPPGDQLPELVAIAGIALLLAHAVDQGRQNLGSRKDSNRILDIGYEGYAAGLNAGTVWLRTVGFFVAMVAMIGLVWTLGFHVGLPLPVFLYMRFVAKAR